MNIVIVSDMHVQTGAGMTSVATTVVLGVDVVDWMVVDVGTAIPRTFQKMERKGFKRKETQLVAHKDGESSLYFPMTYIINLYCLVWAYPDYPCGSWVWVCT